jgi:hypothetical protein
MSDDGLEFNYTFSFDDGTDKSFTIRLEPTTLNLINEYDGPIPEWAKLEFHKCPNCLLDERLDPYCPAALSLLTPVEAFKDSISYEEAVVSLSTPARNYTKRTSLQEGLSAMVGLRMATSGCPAFERLKPMVRFHMPFATSEETAYRALSMYLFAQYIIYKRGGGDPDWDLKYLDSMYDRIREVNKYVVTRLQNIKVKDASLNALINLDCFAISVKFSINLEMIDEIEYLFAGYM